MAGSTPQNSVEHRIQRWLLASSPTSLLIRPQPRASVAAETTASARCVFCVWWRQRNGPARILLVISDGRHGLGHRIAEHDFARAAGYGRLVPDQ
jgi:hypothetical protein